MRPNDASRIRGEPDCQGELSMNYLKAYRDLGSESEIAAFVSACEEEFENKLRDAAAAVCAHDEVRLVALSGPSCSGKTTTANKLISELSAHGKKVHVVSIDDFYYDKEYLHARAAADPEIEIDYDSVSTIDLPALTECIREIFSDEETLVPRFDFKQGKRVGYTHIDPSDDDLFIFEGIQAIYPEITALFAEHPSRSVYICVESGIDCGGTKFEPNEIRMLRRLVRDFHFRNSSPEFTLYLWESVRANEEKNIFPYVSDVDIRIDSALPFEINLLKPYLEDILSEIPENNEFIGLSRSIIEKIADIRPIDKKYLRENSLYYEFI